MLGQNVPTARYIKSSADNHETTNNFSATQSAMKDDQTLDVSIKERFCTANSDQAWPKQDVLLAIQPSVSKGTRGYATWFTAGGAIRIALR